MYLGVSEGWHLSHVYRPQDLENHILFVIWGKKIVDLKHKSEYRYLSKSILLFAEDLKKQRFEIPKRVDINNVAWEYFILT